MLSKILCPSISVGKHKTVCLYQTLARTSIYFVRSLAVQRFSTMSDFQIQKEKFLSMAPEERRQFYKNSSYCTPDKIKSWDLYYQQQAAKLKTNRNKGKIEVDKYEVRPDLNQKVAAWKGDITELEIDAIVNAANNKLLGGGGVDGAIHRAAGKGLYNECKSLNGCETGDAKITGGYQLPAKYVIHTVGPVGKKEAMLESCYKKCLQLLTENNLRSVAFPCISTGVYGYPQEDAATVALRTVRTFLEKNSDKIDKVIFCLFLDSDVKIYNSLMQLYFPVETAQK